MLRLLKRTVLTLAALALGAGILDFATYDADAWRADYVQVKRDMAQGYANLDWIAAQRWCRDPARPGPVADARRSSPGSRSPAPCRA